MIATPRPVELVVAKLAPGWRYGITHGEGVVVRKPVDENTRKQVTVEQPVRSVTLRLRHLDGRAAIAIWLAVWIAEHVVPARRAERKATKTLGARTVITPEQHVPGEWRYSFHQAFAWNVCADPECPRFGTDHPAAMPRELGAIGDNGIAAYVSGIAAYVSGDVAPVLAPFPLDDAERIAA